MTSAIPSAPRSRSAGGVGAARCLRGRCGGKQVEDAGAVVGPSRRFLSARWFRDWAQTHQPQWTEAVRLPGSRAGLTG
jgi:hypothetical protein